MGRLNWGLITDGATFEALVRTLVLSEDAKARPLGRDGRDAGQDARSGDDRVVYQAKFHRNGEPSTVIRQALAERDKVAAYLKDGDPRKALWDHVTKWVLVTNVGFNPRDHATWEAEVAVAFAELGIEALYWEASHLEAKLAEHPDVERAFFGGSPRALLGLSEAWVVMEQLSVVPNSLYGPLRGRDSELEEGRQFLESEAMFALIHGPGGVGKSRFALEFGEKATEDGWLVLYVVESGLDGSWFQGLPAGRPTLVVLDEPSDSQVVRRLIDQVMIPAGHASRWKIAVTVRTPKDPVVRFLRTPQLSRWTQEIELAPLQLEAAVQQCTDLLEARLKRSVEWTTRVANQFARDFSQHPIWMAMAIDLLARRDSLEGFPSTVGALADQYLDEVADWDSGESTPAILRMVALLDPFNWKDDSQRSWLVNLSGLSESSLRSAISSLVDRRALVRRGAFERLIEVKPDVLRDHILRRWLLSEGLGDCEPTEEATALTDSLSDALIAGTAAEVVHSVLLAFARLELWMSLEGIGVHLVRSVLERVRGSIGDMGSMARLSLVKFTTPIAGAVPLHAVGISRAIRGAPSQPETIGATFGKLEIDHSRVVLELAWMVFHAGIGATTQEQRREVLRELGDLVATEAEMAQTRPRGLPNDGRRAMALLQRLIGGEDGAPGAFGRDASGFARTALTGLANGGTKFEPLVEGLVSPLLAVERERMESHDYSLTIHRFVIHPDADEWAVRASLIAIAREALNGPASATTAPVLWKLLAEAHRSALHALDRISDDAVEVKAKIRDDALGDLDWTLGVLQRRALGDREMQAAREMWDWHAKYDQDQEFVDVAQQCEAAFLASGDVAEFQPLFEFDHEHPGRAAQQAGERLAALTAEEIAEWVHRAVQYGRSQRHTGDLYSVASNLGRVAPDREQIQRFVRQYDTAGELAAFARTVCRSWCMALRSDGQLVAARVLAAEALERANGDLDGRIQVWHALYGRLSANRDLLGPEDVAIVRSSFDDHRAAGRLLDFLVLIGWSFQTGWDEYKDLAGRCVDSLGPGEVASAVSAVAEAVHHVVRDELRSSGAIDVPEDLVVWILGLALRIPELDDFGGMGIWYVRELLKHLPKPKVQWLPGALETRLTLFPLGGDHGRPVPWRNRISGFVAPIQTGDEFDERVVQAFEALLDIAERADAVGYIFPQYLHDVDPDGVVVPTLALQRLDRADSVEAVYRMARIAGPYPESSATWRRIAAVVCEKSSGWSDKDRSSALHALEDPRPRTYSSAIGEVPQLFFQAVETARSHLEAEVDDRLRPFWRWRLRNAEAELEFEEQRAKEARGE